MAMRDADVLIAGAGPTGLMLAGELALAGVEVAIVERRASQELAGSRAGGLHSRTIEVLDQRGIADRFLAEGQKAQATGFAGVHFDLSGFPTRHPYSLGLRQNHIERILAGWVDELKVPIYRGIEVTGFAQDDTGVDVELSDGRSLRAQYLVGCDGGRSLVRTDAGIAFPGSDPTTSNLIAEAGLAETPPDSGSRRGKGAPAPPPSASMPSPGRVRDPQRRDSLRGSRTGRRPRDRTARWTDHRTHPQRSQRGAHHRLRDRLRDPLSHLYFPVHRCCAAGGLLPQGTRADRG